MKYLVRLSLLVSLMVIAQGQARTTQVQNKVQHQIKQTPSKEVVRQPSEVAIDLYMSLDRTTKKEAIAFYKANMSFIQKVMTALGQCSKPTTRDTQELRSLLIAMSEQHNITITEVNDFLQKLSIFVKSEAGNKVISQINKLIDVEYQRKLADLLALEIWSLEQLETSVTQMINQS